MFTEIPTIEVHLLSLFYSTGLRYVLLSPRCGNVYKDKHLLTFSSPYGSLDNGRVHVSTSPIGYSNRSVTPVNCKKEGRQVVPRAAPIPVYYPIRGSCGHFHHDAEGLGGRVVLTVVSHNGAMFSVL